MLGLRAAGAICEPVRSRPRPPRHSALLVRSHAQIRTKRAGPPQCIILWLISLFIVATKICPISPAISKSRDIASRASSPLEGMMNARLSIKQARRATPEDEVLGLLEKGLGCTVA